MSVAVPPLPRGDGLRAAGRPASAPGGPAEGAAARRRLLAMLQGGYFAASGVWPLVHMRSFEAVTGPKTDRWLVRTVGALIGAAGGVLLFSAARRRVSADAMLLAISTAAVLGAVDVVYVARRRIPPVYLLDAAAEGALLACWTAAIGAPAQPARPAVEA